MPSLILGSQEIKVQKHRTLTTPDSLARSNERLRLGSETVHSNNKKRTPETVLSDIRGKDVTSEIGPGRWNVW